MWSNQPIVLAIMTGLCALSCAITSNGQAASVGEQSQTEVTPAKRLPVPDLAAQREAEKLVHTAFGQEYAKKTADDRVALADKLRRQAGEPGNDGASRFVLLRDSRDLAAEGGDYQAAVDVIDDLAKVFAIDPLDMKLTVLTSAAGRPYPMGAKELARALLTLSAEAEVAENSEAADKAARAAVSIARKTGDAGLVSHVNEVAAAAEKGKKLHAAADAAVQRLKALPNDPQANLVLGRYLCFNRNRWVDGLPYLAKVSDPILRELAQMELAAANDAAVMMKLADGWWEFPDDKDEIVQTEAQGRAAYWYKRALPNLSGLKKVAAVKRIAAAKPTSSDGYRHVDLLPLIDVKRDAAHGDWTMESGELVCGRLANSRLNLPYQPRGDYDFHIEFTRAEGNEIRQFVVTPKGAMIWVLGAYHGTVSQFDRKDPNPTRVNAQLVDANRRCSSVVQVRKNGVKAFVDGKQVAEWKTDYSDIQQDPKARLGLGTENSATTFHGIEIIEIGLARK
jgi:hypothetical protein